MIYTLRSFLIMILFTGIPTARGFFIITQGGQNEVYCIQRRVQVPT